MHKELDEKIFNDFPELFKNVDNLKVSLMAFGFECADGWFDLIYNLCKNIKAYYKGNIPERFSVVQVKEKFGGLRFYITSAPMEVHNMIAKAELESYRICEHCGKKHAVVKGKYTSFYRDDLDWVLTLCDNCLDKHILKKYHRKRKPGEDFISGWQKENGSPYKIVRDI